MHPRDRVRPIRGSGAASAAQTRRQREGLIQVPLMEMQLITRGVCEGHAAARERKVIKNAMCNIC